MCRAEGAIVPERHSRAIFHLARQPRTAVSATAAALDLRETMDKDTDRRRWTDETCLEPASFKRERGATNVGRVF